MERRPHTTIFYGQICLYAGLLLAILIRPHGLATNNGISYYGTFGDTVLPYAAGILGGAFCLLKAAEQLTGPAVAVLKFGLNAMVPFMAIIVITPYSVGQLMDWTHAVAGAILFIIQLLLSGWLIWKLHYDALVVVLTLVEFGAGVACLLYLAPSNGLLLQFQVAFQIAFGALLIYSLNRLEHTEEFIKRTTINNDANDYHR